MTLALYLAAIIVPALVLYVVTVKRHFDICSFYILGHIFLFVPAATLMVFGLQGGDTNPFLDHINFDETLMLQGMLFALHSVGILAGYVLLSLSPAAASARTKFSFLPRFSDNRSNIMTFIGLGLLTLINLAIIAGPFIKGGGVVNAILLIRNEFYFSGMNYLRIFIVVGTFLAAAHFAHMIKSRKIERSNLLSLAFASGVFAANLFVSIFLGGKGFLVYPLMFFFLALYADKIHKRIGLLVMMSALFITSIVALQQIRVELVHDNQNLSSWDYAYVGLRFRLFEDNLVYLGTDDDLHQTQRGEDFINGALGPVPRSLWKDKPDEITAGARFKRQLMPDSGGGWPPYGMNQWYVNFGWLGVLMGGALTGMLLSALQSRYSDYQTNAYSCVIMMMLLVRLLINGGIDNMFFVEYVFYVLPLFIFAWLTDKRLYATPDAGLRIVK